MKLSVRAFGVAALVWWLAPVAFSADPPAAAIASKMADVTDDLNRVQTGKPVQAKQKAIVHDLDQLIAKLEKERENAQNGIKRLNPTSGMRDSMISRGPGGIGTLINPDDGAKDWAKLSERERDRILQSMSEGFPPEYRTVLERYYRRLAEEKGNAKGAKAAEPSKAPVDKP